MICDNLHRKENSNTISLVIGDTLNKTFEITGLDLSLVKEVHFICSDLGLDIRLGKYLVDNEINYCLELSKEETSQFSPCITDYDIKIIFVDDNIYTASYRSSFIIQENKNPYIEEVFKDNE